MCLEKYLSDITMKKILKYIEISPEEKPKVYYGISIIYINIIKTSLVLLLALLIGIGKETIIFLLAFSLLRCFAFGIHAEKSFNCTIINFVIFIGGTYICKYINISIFILYLLAIITLIAIIKYAPADTRARPLTDLNQRTSFRRKAISVFFILFTLSVLINNYLHTKLIIVAMFIEALNIMPITYKIFKKPYKNFTNLN